MNNAKHIFSVIKSDLRLEKKNIIDFIIHFFFNAPFRLALNYRLGNFCIKTNRTVLFWLSYYLKYKQITKRNCQIAFNAHIGLNLFFPHPLGVVIGEGVIIGNNATIYQNVTIGSHGNKNKKIAYPKIGDNVIIYSGAILIGDIEIGDNCIIGANSFINKNIPSNCMCFGSPIKIINNKV